MPDQHVSQGRPNDEMPRRERHESARSSAPGEFIYIVEVAENHLETVDEGYSGTRVRVALEKIDHQGTGDLKDACNSTVPGCGRMCEASSGRGPSERHDQLRDAQCGDHDDQRDRSGEDSVTGPCPPNQHK